VDAHKPGPNKPEIAEPGGIAPLLSFTFSILIVLFILSIEQILRGNQEQNTIVSITLLGGVLSVVIAGLIGLVDDVFNIRWRYKIALGFLPALPLMVLRAGTPQVNIPFIGTVDFGIIFPLVFVPLAVNFAFNSFNMLAGFNGLETGMGIVSFLTVFLIVVFGSVPNPEIALFTACMLGGLVALLYFNWYPAKILIGDTGTLTFGTGIAVAIILGNVERLAIGIFFLYFINFIMFFLYLFSGVREKLATIDEQGYIKPPSPYTIYWLLPYYFKLKEVQNVLIIIALQAFFCIFSIAFFFFTY
jgi:UDP-N-acetylglucosamine--dolichyl-phosphate N-acetylglucosaminephosphotransferase